MTPEIEIKILDKRIGNEFPMMTYATDGSAAIDVMAMDDAIIRPGEQQLIPLGFALHILDNGIAAILLPRSGMGARGLVLGNLVGLIDSDYQGQVQAVAWNRQDSKHDGWKKDIEIKAGERIAQLMFVPVIRPALKVVNEFSASTVRGEGGFGSTGTA